jgi:signal transduction histidine kinase
MAVVTVLPERGRGLSARWRSASVVLGSSVLVGLLGVLAGISYWAGHPLAGMLAFAMSAALAGAGLLLSSGTGSRASGAYLFCAAVLGAVSWVSAWNRGLLPALGEIAQSLFFFFLGSGVLLSGRPRFEYWFEWAWCAFAVLVLPVQEVVTLALASPRDLGYSVAATWPSLHIPSSDVTLELEIGGWLYLALAVTLIAALIAQQARQAHAAWGRNLLVLLCVGAFAVGAAAAQWSIMSDNVSLDRVFSVRTVQMGAAIVIPLGLFATALAAKWEEITVADKLKSLLAVITPASVETALRTVLRDGYLRIWLWVPGKGCFVDGEGHIRSPEEASAAGRQLYTVQTAAGETLALCDIREPLAGSRLLAAATQAAASALLAAQLHVEGLEQVRAVQARLLDVELQTRQELARNIHDGVQQDLAALAIDVARLRRRCPTDELRELAGECGDRITDITEAVRRIGRGLHPQALMDRGLAGALEEHAERLGRNVALDIAPVRLPPPVEVAMYYMLAEALTNVQKHSQASHVAVSLEKAGDLVTAVVSDDGVGGAAPTIGGGLHGIDDRARAMRGALKIDSRHARGTRLSISIPLTGGAP